MINLPHRVVVCNCTQCKREEIFPYKFCEKWAIYNAHKSGWKSTKDQIGKTIWTCSICGDKS